MKKSITSLKKKIFKDPAVGYVRPQFIMKEAAKYKDEIYVTWHSYSERFIRVLLDCLAEADNQIEVHVFLYEAKFELERKARHWPENIYFHVAYTNSESALQTCLIAYVFEKFSKISDTLTMNLSDFQHRARILLIQKTVNQFQEIKCMLEKMPFLKNAFIFQLLYMNMDMNVDMLFETFSNALDNNDTPEITSPREIFHGRRSKNLKIDQPKAETYKDLALKEKKKAFARTNALCVHCERKKGSNPYFENKFCLACFLDGKLNINAALCRQCQRPKNFLMVDRGTSTSDLGKKVNRGTQFPLIVENSLSIIDKTKSNPKIEDRKLENNAVLDNKVKTLDVKRNDVIQKKEDKHKNATAFRINEIPVNPVTRKYHCPFCKEKLFDKLAVFEVHLKNVHKKCNCSCEQYFESREDYIEHFYKVFPLPCFKSRKCPERFRSLHYQATHHGQEHHMEKPYCCVPCYNNGIPLKEIQFRDIFGLEEHAEIMGHDIKDLLLSIKITDVNERIPPWRRSSAINFSG